MWVILKCILNNCEAECPNAVVHAIKLLSIIIQSVIFGVAILFSMEILRKTITPLTAADLLIHLPETFLNSEVEIIAFPVSAYLETPVKEVRHKRTYDEAVQFYKKNAVPFLTTWKRDELYE